MSRAQARRSRRQPKAGPQGSPLARYPWLGPLLLALVLGGVLGSIWWYSEATTPRIPDVGDQAPDFALAEVSDGETVQLSHFRGSPVVLVFYRTWT